MERALKSLVLIRAKHLAESVTAAMFLTDDAGNLIFYNEAAEVLLGRPFADAGTLTAKEWQQAFDVRSRDGEPFPLEAMPGWMVLQKHQPTLGHLRFRSLDGTERTVAVCAVPLFSGPDRFEGAQIIFWEEEAPA